jgi:hypothetical protein
MKFFHDFVLLSNRLLQQIISTLKSEFAGSDLGSLYYFLGIHVTRHKNALFLSQQQYVTDILNHASMVDFKPVNTRTQSPQLGFDSSSKPFHVAVLLVAWTFPLQLILFANLCMIHMTLFGRL